MGCLYVDRESSSKVDDGQPRVSDRVRQRMQQMAAGELPHARPLLLFPEGTTTNGRYLLPFKTGAFLAGEPLRPVVIRYGEVSGLCGCESVWLCAHACTSRQLQAAWHND
jgi:lysophosphatidylcholine acyltransferase/lyso-PAF acetyltransferase